MEQINYVGYTILVAEDDAINFEYIAHTFQNTGLNILRATNGQEAVECCLKHPEISMILMDAMMPLLTGFEATREIRKFRPELPVVILTAYVSQTSIREAVSGGCTDYLAKPIGPDELLAVLKKWLIV